MKKHWLVLSPHLDDAAFSVGPLIAGATADRPVTVATAFAGSVARPRGFALACQTDKGLPADADYMALRRREDLEWAERLGATTIHGSLREAPHRGYDSAAALFSGIHSADFVGTALENWLSRIVAELEPELVFLPLGIGSHVDHVWLRQAAETALSHRVPLVYYGDQPYCAKRQQSPMDTRLPHANDLAAYSVTPDAAAVREALSASEAYRTQIPFQFGTCRQMRHQLRLAWEESLYLFLTESATHHTAQISQSVSHMYARS